MTTLRKNIYLNIGLFAFLYIFNSTISSKVQLPNTPTSIRLPTAIQPIKYHLHINSSIHEDNLDFSGKVGIEFVVTESTSEIVLHAKELRDLKISLKDERSRGRFENLKYTLQKEKDFLRIPAPKTLHSGERYRLEISYLGKIIQGESYGIYKTSYLDEFYNKSMPLALTQFEPNNARSVFPCFDEPSFRANIILTITHGTYYTALSNMPIDGQPRWSDNMITTMFRETPAMPTYLFGFVICNFHFTNNFDTSMGIEHRVYYPPNAKDKGSRAIQNSIQSVRFVENYLGIEFPLPKLDHIHVKDADMVVMDWGLAIYNDDEFLATLESRDLTVRRIILQNYQIAQQWFANMVSLKWWSFVWINSGLGTYFSYKITDSIYPTWKIEEYFILTEVDDLLKQNMSEPLVKRVETQADIDSITSDEILFQMGACIIKMFDHAIGNETFKKGLVNYLSKFKNSVADEDDFLGAIQSAIAEDYVYLFQTDKSLPEIMKTWTHNHGIPAVKVTRHYNGTITIKQKSYSGNGGDKWWIPLNFATASNGNFARTTADYIMPPLTEVSIDLEDINVSLMSRDWLILNKQQTGLYYVIYDDRNLELIAKALNEDHTAIHMLNRALLFRDLKAVLDTDLGAIEPVLELIKYLKNEQDSMPWFEASELINELWPRLKGGKAFELFRTFINDIIGNFYHKLFDLPLYKLSFADSIIKKPIFKLACEVELSECLAHAAHQTKQYIHYNWPIDASSTRFTMCKAMQAFTPEELREILDKNMYTSVTLSREMEFLASLKCITSEENMNLIFDFVHEGERNLKRISILNFMQFYHLSFREKLPDNEKISERRDLVNLEENVPQDLTQKRVEFKRKYEDSIYKWLKDYELKLRF